MTKEEALDRIEEEVESAGAASFPSLDVAFQVAGQALSFIMQNLDDENGSEDQATN